MSIFHEQFSHTISLMQTLCPPQRKRDCQTTEDGLYVHFGVYIAI